MRRLKRSRGVSAAGVVAGALVFLALTPIPAQAALPTITQVLPPSPASTCQVTITGTNFILNGGPVTGITFGGVPAVTWSMTADTQLEVTLPAGLVASTSYPIIVTTGGVGGGASLPFAFSTGAAGACPGAPTFTPASGATGTTVTLVGAFGTAPFYVRFNASTPVVPTTATPTSATAIVPAGATTGPIRVYTTTGAASSAASFLITTTTVPTISGFTPTSGPTGTSVTINGTNLTGATSVTFNNVAAAAGWVVNATGTQITGAIVPATATDGQIRVTTPGGTAVSATNFDVTGAGGAEHPRTVSLQLSGNQTLKVQGTVSATDGFAACEANVGVKIQKQKSGGWNTLTTLQTNQSGSYKGYIPAKSGAYRAKAPNVTLLNNATCGADTSPKRNY